MMAQAADPAQLAWTAEAARTRRAANQRADVRTVMATPAPVVVSQQQANAPQATMMLPDSQGVVAYAQERRLQAALEEVGAADSGLRTPAASDAVPGLAWIVLGIGAGLGVHFYLIQRAVQ